MDDAVTGQQGRLQSGCWSKAVFCICQSARLLEYFVMFPFEGLEKRGFFYYFVRGKGCAAIFDGR